MKVFFNDRIIPLEKARLSVLDRGFLYGDGVFESFRTYNRKPFLLAAHLKRLLAGAKFLKIRGPFSSARLDAAIDRTIAANPFKECYIKVIITRGQAVGHGLDISNACGKPTLLILVEEFAAPPKELYHNGWSVIIPSIRRADQPTSRIKSLCYLDNLLAKAEAKKKGANEALMLNEKGDLVEGTVSNFFLVKGGSLYTPPLAEPILSGVTRHFVIGLARKQGIKIIEKELRPRDLYQCHECFLTLSSLGIVPVTRVGHKKIGSGKCGPVTGRLRRSYPAEVR